MHDDGHAIAYKALKRGTLVRSSDGVEVGTVARVQDNVRENIFDGIVIAARDGTKRFIDAPEVGHIAERAVTLAITAAEVDEQPVPRSRFMQRLEHAPIVRRARRTARDLRDR